MHSYTAIISTHLKENKIQYILHIFTILYTTTLLINNSELIRSVCTLAEIGQQFILNYIKHDGNFKVCLHSIT